MKRTRLVTAALIIGACVVLGFALSVPHTHDQAQQTSQAAPVSSPPVMVHDAFHKGVHTLTGTIILPNACGSATVSATATSSSITLAFVVPPDSGVCLQISTSVPYTTAVAGAQGLPILATVNGVAASTTLK